MRKKHIFINTSMGLCAVSILSILSVTSCVQKSFYSNQDIGGLNNWLEETNVGKDAIKNASDNLKQDYNKNPEDENLKKAYDLLNQKTIQISTGGKVNDHSFNQLVWETISNFSKAIGNDNNRYYETLAITQEMQNTAYDYAISNGYKIWVLTGFQQADLLKNWLKIGKNQERFDSAGIKIITVDWYDDSLAQPGRILGLNFKTQESSFVISYSAAKLVSEIYPGEENINNRYFSTFAGGDFSGATNFNYGFYEGMRKWNSEQSKDDLTKKVASTVKNEKEAVELLTSFTITNDSRQKVNEAVDGYASQRAPKVIMPVAGSLTSVAIDRVKAKKSEQWVVGVDTDMSLTFPTDKDIILTSSEKKIAIAVYKALSLFYGLNDVLSNNKISEVEMKWDGDNYIMYSTQENANIKPTSFNIEGGYKEGFVGVSKSTLNPSLKFTEGIHKDKTYAQRFDEIVSETWAKFFDSNLLENEKLTEEEQKFPILKNNVYYGHMTAGNLNNYFNLAILGGTLNTGSSEIEITDYINNWLPKKYLSDKNSDSFSDENLLLNQNLSHQLPINNVWVSNENKRKGNN